ncbi:MAG TPA: hypothetical protein VK669_05115 [Candidatus Limnocylindrales bacterium]|nr:hypothetical protein [Candidatus Limnocylindrales bacterium]
MTWSIAGVVRDEDLVAPGETVRWSGTPPSGIVFRGSDALLVPFSLLWGGFAIFWESMAVRTGVPFMIVWGIPFVAAGLYMIAGRFVWDAYVRSRTRYLVTDRAAYVVTRGIGGATRRFSGPTLGDVRIDRRGDGTGTLLFGPYVPFRMSQRGMMWQGTPPDGFERVHDVQGAYDAVLAAARA